MDMIDEKVSDQERFRNNSLPKVQDDVVVKNVAYAACSTAFVGCWELSKSLNISNKRRHIGYFVIEYIGDNKYYYCQVPDETIGKRYVEHVASMRTMGLALSITMQEGLPRFFPGN